MRQERVYESRTRYAPKSAYVFLRYALVVRYRSIGHGKQIGLAIKADRESLR